MQYPHILTITTYPKATQDEATGNWLPPAPPETVQYNCRYEVAKSAPKVVGIIDGQRIEASGVCYLPRTDIYIPIGAEAVVTKGNEPPVKTTVKQFSAGIFNSTAWL